MLFVGGVEHMANPLLKNLQRLEIDQLKDNNFH
jgi:hypothetical protein